MDIKSVTIRMRTNLIERIKILAKTEGQSFQKTIIEIIEWGLIDIYKHRSNYKDGLE